MALDVPRKDEAAQRHAALLRQGTTAGKVGSGGIDRHAGVSEQGVPERVAADLLATACAKQCVHDVIAIPEWIAPPIGARILTVPVMGVPRLGRGNELRMGDSAAGPLTVVEIEMADEGPGSRDVVGLEQRDELLDDGAHVGVATLELTHREVIEAAPDQLGVEGEGERPWPCHGSEDIRINERPRRGSLLTDAVPDLTLWRCRSAPQPNGHRLTRYKSTS